MAGYDCIVIGVGGVGSAAVYHLAERGARVLGIDPFPPGHTKGSSHGQTRIIRFAYLEHPDYVPLVRRAYSLWTDLAKRTEQRLFFQTGLLQLGPGDGPVVSGVLASARVHRLDIEQLTAEEIRRRFPAFQLPDSMAGVFEPQAGYLPVETCVQTHVAEARRMGAKVSIGERVTGWKPTQGSVEVVTDCATYHADRLIIAGGAWANSMLPNLSIAFEVRRKSLFWYIPHTPAYAASSGCPIYLFETPDGVFYGFPALDSVGIKVGEHSGGQTVGNPLHVKRDIDRAEQQRVETFLDCYLPGVSRTCARHEVCLYTMSPDEHFVVDRHPDSERVVFAAGLSGHGFKFVPALGLALSELVLDGHTSMPVDFLSTRRLVAHDAA